MSSPSEKECYKLIQMVAVKQDPICILPGCCQPSMVGHHIFKRDRNATAFLPEAVRGMCIVHHDWAHHYPFQCENIWIELLGPKRYYELVRLSWTVVPDINFEEIRDGLKKILDTGKNL